VNVAQVAAAALRRNLDEVRAHQIEVGPGMQAEDLHDLRVAVRRIRTAVRLFEAFLPPCRASTVEDLEWLGDVLGEVRELDIEIDLVSSLRELRTEEIDQYAGMLIDLLDRRRERAVSVAAEALSSSRAAETFDDLESMCTSLGSSTGAGSTPAEAALPSLVRDRYGKARRAAKTARWSRDLADFHRLRIRCKRLRYLLEFSEEVYGDAVRPGIGRLVLLQDLLGDLQDSRASSGRLTELATGNAEVPPSVSFAAGTAVAAIRRRETKLVRKASYRSKLLARSRWKSIFAALEEPTAARERSR
jgi:CHAD domain-containing protein